jgi:catechol-2,3-dioxygenase
MSTRYAPAFAHMGIFCRDVDRMTEFYCAVFDLTRTDRGQGHTMHYDLQFLSGSGDQHHQVVLASGRGADTPSTVMQMSFKVQSLDELREARRRALEGGATKLRGLSHGNALSIYFSDPEDNTIEIYLDTPWHVSQPHGNPLDLDLPDEEIWAATERAVRADASFKPMAQWRDEFRRPRDLKTDEER